jgi:putative peptidoglycan lipid II flippase
MLLGQRFFVAGHPLGPAGLALGSGIAAWLEWSLLRRALRKRLGEVLPPADPLLRMLLAAGVAAAAGWGCGALLPPLHPVAVGALVLAAFVAVYLGTAAALGVPEVKGVTGWFRRPRR